MTGGAGWLEGARNDRGRVFGGWASWFETCPYGLFRRRFETRAWVLCITSVIPAKAGIQRGEATERKAKCQI